MARTFVVGDIHGWADRLERLLERLRAWAAPGDSLVFIGDYVDRGPQSRRVVEMALAEREQWDGPVVTLKGNHEAMMLEALAERDPYSMTIRHWVDALGGRETISSYAGGDATLNLFRACLPACHRQFFDTLALWHEDEHAIYVHGGIPPGADPARCSEEELLWIRDPFIRSDYAWPKPVVFGHTPQYDNSRGEPTDLEDIVWQPLNRPEKIGIDTGCAYGGPLTALVLPEREFVCVGRDA